MPGMLPAQMPMGDLSNSLCKHDSKCKTKASKSTDTMSGATKVSSCSITRRCFGAGKTAEDFGAAVSSSGQAAAASIRQKAKDATIKLRDAGQDLLAGPQVCTDCAHLSYLCLRSCTFY